MRFWKPPTVLKTLLTDREVLESSNDSEFSPFVFESSSSLPILKHRKEILFGLEQTPVLIIVGETGSGKTTQIPQFLLQANWAKDKMIGCTQPRRIAAITTAHRVAHELNTSIGSTVGYVVRFDEKWDPEKTRIKFCTDGMLLRETMNDPLLSAYSVIILDEAHERSLQTDILLGLLKKILRIRSDLRLIVSSATLQVHSFLKFFDDKKIKERHKTEKSSIAVSVEGRQFPVDIQYLEQPASNYVEKTIETVLSIHKSEKMGDILAFLPGQEEIEYCVREVSNRLHSHKNDRSRFNLVAYPLYSALPKHLQEQALGSSSSTLLNRQQQTRKVIFATNIAETSLTIDGILYVVDCCFVKSCFYNPINGLECKVTVPISKASANQRAGRAGRIQHGKCFRLVTYETFHYSSSEKKLKRPLEQNNDHDDVIYATTAPEIQRTNLATVVLQLLALGIKDILHFDWLSPPHPESLIRALELLYSLHAIDDSAQLIEPIGTQLAEFPTNPQLATVLIRSHEFNCVEEILTIASMVSLQNIFINARGSKERKALIAEAMGEFAHPMGDHLTYVNVYDRFLENDKSSQWCQENYIDFRALSRAEEIRKQFKRYVYRFRSNSAQNNIADEDKNVSILKCITSGYFENAAKLDANGTYRTIKDGRFVELHPTSVFNNFGNSPEYIIYHENTLTTKEFARDVSKIDPRWLVEIATDFYNCTETSLAVSGSSGEVGLPNHNKNASNSKIVFRKPSLMKKKKKSTLPVHIGKAKGGLRSQF